MRARADFFLEGLLALDRSAPAGRRPLFRQTIASLATAGPGRAPFDGEDEAALALGVKTALADGLFDDLHWIGRPAAGAALFEIAQALPLGAERREIGRRLLGELYGGDAATFAAIATRMAGSGSVRAFSSGGVRARVALALALPASAEVAVDPLALAILSRAELRHAWVTAPASGSLPDRRLAGRLLERAAREAALRARRGEPEALAPFEHLAERGEKGAPRATSETVEGAFRSLLADRETLVWRHVAAARGLLSAALPEVSREISSALSPRLGVTEWRRGATSLAAAIAVDPEKNLPIALGLVKGPLLERDPACSVALLWGVPRAADVEPEAAGHLVDAIARAFPLLVAEEMVELRAELGDLVAPAAELCAEALASFGEGAGPDRAFAERLREDLLDPGATATRSLEAPELELRRALGEAVAAFVSEGSREAHALALEAMNRASATVTALEAAPPVGDEEELPDEATTARGTAALREIDRLLLESRQLEALLVLDKSPSDPESGVDAVDALDDRLAMVLLDDEAAPLAEGAGPAEINLHLRKLRALLHLVDGETTGLGDDAERRERVLDRWTSTCRVLLARLAEERQKTLRRPVAATVARALDALVREGAAEPADALLYAAFRTGGPADLSVLAEASMSPEVWKLLHAYARFIDEELTRPFDNATDAEAPASTSSPSMPAVDAPVLPSLDGLIAALPAGGSPRLDALRVALGKLGKGLAGVQVSTSLRPLTDPSSSPLVPLSEGLEKLAQLTAGALRRCGGGDEPIAALPASPFPLLTAAGRAVSVGADVARILEPTLTTTLERAFAAIPRALAGLVARILPRLGRLPIDPPRRSFPPPSRAGDAAPISAGPLPAWLPARRTLGGFYVHHQLGGGAAGTVFVVSRAEERHEEGAERFALKVPDYDATAARSLSEADFLKLFREEAGALLAVPEHENVARFVTFDAGARPKPILVMELVEGSDCDQLVESGRLDLPQVFDILDGVLAGLAAMHSVGVAHLDLKPSNVIRREKGAAVLVDFGLAGRHLRPGCGTAAYGAPEIWGVAPPQASPTAADVYSFGCLAYELLTGETLFEGPSEIAIVSSHLIHDGDPAGVKKLGARPATAPLAALLRRCLRRDPRQRTTAEGLREDLQRAGKDLGGRVWPIPH